MKKFFSLKEKEILQKNANFSENLVSLKKSCRIFFVLVCVVLAIFMAGTAQILCTQNLLQSRTQNFSQVCAQNSSQNENFQTAAQSLQRVQDEVFNVALSGTTRSQGSATFSQQTATDYLGQEHAYLVANWKDLLRFNFAIRGQNTESRKMVSYKLRVQYAKTDNLSGVVWSGATKTITSDTVNSAAQSYSANFDFNVDGMEYKGQVYGGGYGYGLYHFTFSYMFALTGAETSPICEATLSDGFYVAVLPDDPKTIQPKQDIRLLYSETHSDQLLNKYTFSISDSAFNYTKGELIQWDATGTDSNGVHYCLTEYSRLHQPLYNNYMSLYPVSQNPTGKTFEFDSCGIEGLWTITCTITNNDGSVKMQLIKSNISTYKAEIKAFDPTITIIIVLAVMLGVLALIVAVLSIQLVRERKL